jgi:hypothetical protein
MVYWAVLLALAGIAAGVVALLGSTLAGIVALAAFGLCGLTLLLARRGRRPRNLGPDS